jgi:hypothetical protein
VAALSGLVNDAHYKEWFGVHTTTRFNKVKSNYTSVKTRMESVQFTYNLTRSGCGSGVYAYTYKGTSTIWFCDQFWAAPALGTDSRQGPCSRAHPFGRVDGRQCLRPSGLPEPRDQQSNKAVANADSHEYYDKG